MIITSEAREILIVSLLSLITAQLIKFFLDLFKNKRPSLEALITTGGTPSSHTSFVTTLVFSIAIVQQEIDVVFVLAFVFAMVTIHDAMGVRYEAGQHAKAINKIIDESGVHVEHLDGKLKELLGHKPIEVLAGLILGIVMAFVGCAII